MRQINNGFEQYYYLTEEGNVYNQKADRYIKPYNGSYKLVDLTGKVKSISKKKLYRLVYNKEFCLDNIELLKGEMFKEIPNTDGKYYISNYGRIKSYEWAEARILKPTKTKKGYLRVQIIQEGMKVNRFIHTLVANTWLGQPESLDIQVHHKDFNRSNAKVTNLEYLTRVQHQKKHSERRREEKNANCSKSESDRSS